VQQLTCVLTGRAHIDQWLAEVVQYLITERAELLVITLDDRVDAGGTLRRVGADRAGYGVSRGVDAVQQAQVRVPE